MTDAQISEHAPREETILFSSFYLDDTFCGIDINRVQEINDDFNITKVPLSPDYVEGIMNLRGRIVTIINQGRKLGFSPTQIKAETKVIIVNLQDEQIGVLVDRINDVITAPRKAIVAPPSNIKGVQGKFFDGIFHADTNELLAILNLEEVLAV